MSNRHSKSLSALGGRIRTLRENKGIKLKDLAQASELSEAFLSRLERGLVSSSIGNLIQIAEALGVDMSDLFSDAPNEKPPAFRIYREEEDLSDSAVQSNGYRWNLLAGGQPNDHYEIFLLTFPLKNPMNIMVSHPGREYCQILSGRLRFFMGTEVHDLKPGDGVFLISKTPHRVENIGDGEAKVLMFVIKEAPGETDLDFWKIPTAQAAET